MEGWMDGKRTPILGIVTCQSLTRGGVPPVRDAAVAFLVRDFGADGGGSGTVELESSRLNGVSLFLVKEKKWEERGFNAYGALRVVGEHCAC